MSTETLLGILLCTAVICIVWLVLGGRFIFRRLERRIRQYQVDLRKQEHLTYMWQNKARELSEALIELQPSTGSTLFGVPSPAPRRRTRPQPPASWPAQRAPHPSRAYDATPPDLIPPSDKKVIL